jgi:hypothetical protein
VVAKPGAGRVAWPEQERFMTTCPRCGRVADDEIVCADCGMSLALTQRMAAVAAAHAEAAPAPPDGLLDEFGSEPAADEPARDVRVWRLAAIVCATCVLAAVVAIVLLNQHGSRHRSNVGLPLTSGPATTRDGQASSSSTAQSTQASAHPSTSASPTKSSTSPSKSKTSPKASPVSDRSTSAAQGSGSIPSVHAARGALDPSCGPHCYHLVVTLSGFSGGAHQVTCFSDHGGELGSYTTSSTTSSGCSDRRPHDSVYAVVDGRYRSNRVTW